MAEYLPPPPGYDPLANLDKSKRAQAIIALGGGRSTPAQQMLGLEEGDNKPLLRSLGESAAHILGIPKAALEAASGYADTGHYNAGPILDAALLSMSGGVGGTAEGGVALGSGPVKAGLDMSQEARMARAADQGFDTSTPLYHGTSKDVDFQKFKDSRHGTWSTTDPADASGYAKFNDSQGYRLVPGGGWQMEPVNSASRVLPLYGKPLENPYNVMEKGYPEGLDRVGNYKKAQSDWFDQLKSQGYDGVQMPGGVRVDFDNANLRSTVAKFDPKNSGKSMLLGAGPTDESAAAAVGAGRLVKRGNPDYDHPISDAMLRTPLSEMQRDRLLLDPKASPEKLISPEDVVGKVLIPTIGDTSASGGLLTRVGDFNLKDPVGLHGGHGFMSQGDNIWASTPGAATTLANRVRAASEATGKEPVLTYSAMNPQGVDFSRHVADPLSQIMGDQKLSAARAAEFDAMMRGAREGTRFPATPDFPGVRSDNLREWLLSQDTPGSTRAKFAKIADLAKFQQEGLPGTAEVRHAVSDPRLLNVGLGDAGLSMARADPRGLTAPSAHPDYSSGIVGGGGGYMGGFGMSLPPEAVFPQITKTYRERAPTSRFDYLAQRGMAPTYEVADQQWLDHIMPYWLKGSIK
jgi:hypothetical protein